MVGDLEFVVNWVGSVLGVCVEGVDELLVKQEDDGSCYGQEQTLHVQAEMACYDSYLLLRYSHTCGPCPGPTLHVTSSPPQLASPTQPIPTSHLPSMVSLKSWVFYPENGSAYKSSAGGTRWRCARCTNSE